jgi:hypothetical protein
MDVCRRVGHGVDDARLAVDADMGLHPETEIVNGFEAKVILKISGRAG